jgi:glycerol-3-phosphate dehydrogenase
LNPDNKTVGSSQPVLILGGGIHGAAVARELVLNGVPVVLIDTGDLAAGATSKSSRLIHGGLRYLEYGDIRLVRESLVERRRLLELAPHLVQPIRLFVPTDRRWSGLLRSGLGFFKLVRTRLGRRLMGRSEKRAPRGYWPIRIGLWMYDLFSWGDGLPRSLGIVELPADDAVANVPHVDQKRYRWLCAYSDAQMLYPERCVQALLADAQQAARDQSVSLQIVNHARIDWRGGAIRISSPYRNEELVLQPGLVINCSGAWGDLTLQGIEPGVIPLFAGTKGSHLVTRHAGLKMLLAGQGVYAETGDRRLAFILPFDNAVLVGTTDEPWSGPPDQAVASDQELQYLLKVIESVFGITLAQSDIESHYCGVRPLPRTLDTSTAAISRDHFLTEHRLHGVLILTLVGGKLTTFRSVAQQVTDRVLKRLAVTRSATTDQRMLPGGEEFPRDKSAWPKLWQQWATDYQTTVDEVAALWPLYGMQTRSLLASVASEESLPVTGTPFLRRTVRWVIRNEWVATLDDLIERRLMLIFSETLCRQTVIDLSECLVAEGKLARDQFADAMEATIARLRLHYGRDLASKP